MRLTPKPWTTLVERFAAALTSVPGALTLAAALVTFFVLATMAGAADIFEILLGPLFAVILTLFIWARRVGGRAARDEERLGDAAAGLIDDEPILRAVLLQATVRRLKPRCVVLTPSRLAGVRLNWTGRKAIAVEFVDKLSELGGLDLNETTVSQQPTIELTYQSPQGRRRLLFPMVHRDAVRALWLTLHGKPPEEADDAELLDAAPIRRWRRHAFRPRNLAIVGLGAAGFLVLFTWNPSWSPFGGAAVGKCLGPTGELNEYEVRACWDGAEYEIVARGPCASDLETFTLDGTEWCAIPKGSQRAAPRTTPSAPLREARVGDCVRQVGDDVRVLPCTSKGALGKVIAIEASALFCPSDAARTIQQISFGPTTPSRVLCLGPARRKRGPRTKTIEQARAGDCVRVSGDVFPDARVVPCPSRRARKILRIVNTINPNACPRRTRSRLELTGYRFSVLCLGAPS